MAIATESAVSEETARQEIQVACFRLGQELYGLNIMQIKEIIRPQKLTPVPKAPPFIEGVINLRGLVIPVADMRKRFDQVVREEPRKNRILVCALSDRIVGLLVDEVMEVRRFTRKDVVPAPQFIKGPEADFFLGVARQEDRLIMLIDLARVLSQAGRISLPSLDQVAAVTEQSLEEG